MNSIVSPGLALVARHDLIPITLNPINFGISPESSALATKGLSFNAVILDIDAAYVDLGIIVVEDQRKMRVD